MRRCEQYERYVVDVNAKAGDAVIFTEALIPGTLPWKAKHQRRALLYKFSPGYQAFSGGGAHEKSFPDYILDVTEEPRMAMKPSHYRHQRQVNEKFQEPNLGGAAFSAMANGQIKGCRTRR
ncbi:TPA: hypothetical protein EYM82_20605 [Candidatus Poribacteria bacterium]|nr:hypothetical protein [Candidatus Poribacteria bacterium]